MLLPCQYVCIVRGDAVLVVLGVLTNRCAVTNLFTVVTDASLQLPDGLAYRCPCIWGSQFGKQHHQKVVMWLERLLHNAEEVIVMMMQAMIAPTPDPDEVPINCY